MLPPLLKPNTRKAMDFLGDWGTLVEQGKVPKTNAEFIQQLQYAHDGPSVDPRTFVADWKNDMTRLAQNYNLSTSTLDKVPA